MNKADRARGRPILQRVTIGAMISFSVGVLQHLPERGDWIEIQAMHDAIRIRFLPADEQPPTKAAPYFRMPRTRRQLKTPQLLHEVPHGAYPASVEGSIVSILREPNQHLSVQDRTVLESLDPQHPYTIAQIAEHCGLTPRAILFHIHEGYLETDTTWTTDLKMMIATGEAVRAYLEWRIRAYGRIRPSGDGPSSDGDE